MPRSALRLTTSGGSTAAPSAPASTIATSSPPAVSRGDAVVVQQRLQPGRQRDEHAEAEKQQSAQHSHVAVGPDLAQRDDSDRDVRLGLLPAATVAAARTAAPPRRPR
jgi:hypothetical protein